MNVSKTLIGLLLCFSSACVGIVEQGHVVESSEGVVVCVDSIAAEVGAQILTEGGNAVDAAVAVAFALAVTHPQAGNLGGGGFMMIRTSDGKLTSIDYRERAPLAAKQDMFLKPDGTVDKELVQYGFLASAVPGTVAGLYLAHSRYGRLEWNRLVEPACKLAEEGFKVDFDLASAFRRAERDLRRFPDTEKAFFGTTGRAPRVNDWLKQPNLARTLKAVRNGGRDAFYNGPVAEELIRAVKRGGGIIAQADLDTYYAREKRPLRWYYRGVDVATPILPTSGGVVLQSMTNVLAGFNLKSMAEDERAHVLVETMRRAYKDRALYLGDPDFTTPPVTRLISKNYAAELRSQIDLASATPSHTLVPDMEIHPAEPKEGKELTAGKELTYGSGQTTHFCVADRMGTVVSNTYTLERSFGCKAVAGSTGVLLNNEMGDFNLRPGWTGENGAIGTEPNVIAPGKRMLSSMCPVILFKDNHPIAAFGSPGGRTIINTVLQVIVNFADLDLSLEEAIRAPRLHHQWFPDKVYVEKSMPWNVREGLQARGHILKDVDYQGDCHGLTIQYIRRWQHDVTGVADDRIDGCAAAPSRTIKTMIE